MTGGNHTSASRCLAVWLLVTFAVLATWRTVADAAGSLASAQAWQGTFEDLLVAVASAALVVCAGWLWVVTSATVIAVVRGRVPSAPPRGAARRLVLVACGVAVVAGVGSPALAGTGAGDHSLVGLPMPDRAVIGTVSPPTPEPPPVVVDRPTPRRTPSSAAGPAAPIVVRAGDSLWSIAAARLGPAADVAEIDTAWRELYAANVDAIGSDADLILPGLNLEPGPNREARP